MAVSDDLVNWDTSPGCVFSFNSVPDTFDYGGVVLGGLLLDSPRLRDPRTLYRDETDRVWSIYGAYPHRNGYELRPGAQGAAFSADGGLSWQRVTVNESVLSIYGPSPVGTWEQDCIYQPYLVLHQPSQTVYNFYNAARDGDEQSGLATLSLSKFPGVSASSPSVWQRFAGNPVIRNSNSSSFDAAMASDPKVYLDEEIGAWVCFFFGGLRDGHADIMVAFSEDLLHWQVCDSPLYQAGGHPGEYDADHAHKVSLVYDPSRQALVMFYCAVGPHGRGIAALSSKPLL